MSELIVVGFHGKHRAAEVLDQMQQLDAEDWTIQLHDGVAAYRRENGKLRIETSLTPTEKEGAGLGATLGLLAGAILAAPFTAAASTAVAAAAVGASAVTGGTLGAALGGEDAFEWKTRFGISDSFVKQVGGMIQPGDSAVFALIDSHDPIKVAEHFKRYGGTVLRTTLKPGVAAEVQSIIRA
jgi:uncharacterized membrane protein